MEEGGRKEGREQWDVQSSDRTRAYKATPGWPRAARSERVISYLLRNRSAPTPDWASRAADASFGHPFTRTKIIPNR